LLWAAQGITDRNRGFRSAPSGGALYPLDVYVVAGKGGVEGIGAGIYRYLPQKHVLEKLGDGDRRERLAQAALQQTWIGEAPVVFVITAEYSRITGKYGQRGIRYAQIEIGHVGQNIFLQAEALKLRTGIVGAFYDDKVAETIEAPDKHEPMLIMPVGKEK
jgi:SagB-type dehydrogenase family enzyme